MNVCPRQAQVGKKVFSIITKVPPCSKGTVTRSFLFVGNENDAAFENCNMGRTWVVTMDCGPLGVWRLPPQTAVSSFWEEPIDLSA
eukprot:scaffold52743_cov41-Attheya_sp.AAC.3